MSDPLPADFSARLRVLRERAGVSQSELARRAGISRQQVRNYEAGSSEPTYSALMALATSLSISPRDFFAT